MSSVFSIFVQLFFGNFGGIRKKRGFRHRLVYKASRVFEETTKVKGGLIKYDIFTNSIIEELFCYA